MVDKKEMNTVNVKDDPSWISDENIRLLYKQKYQDILRFYIINTPDTEKSVRGKTIPNEEDVLNLLKKDVQVWKSSGNGILVESHLKGTDLVFFPPSAANLTQRVCFSFTKKQELIGFFGHIRNALSHGRFNIMGSEKNPVLVMEDVNRSKNCSARMVTEMATLIKWQKEIEK